jgi:hypothetical protein
MNNLFENYANAAKENYFSKQEPGKPSNYFSPMNDLEATSNLALKNTAKQQANSTWATVKGKLPFIIGQGQA